MKNWYALFTKPRKEHQVADALAEKGIETYVPTIQVRTRRRRLVKRAFFPRYIFARIDFDVVGVSVVRWTPGLTNIVSFDGRPAWVPDEIVERLKERLDDISAAKEDQDYASRFRPGDRVRILDGPFKDFDAVFDRRLSASDRVRVLLDVLGRATKYEIEASQLIPVVDWRDPPGS
jgi:transcription elongation factor/antiterminator RfaH